jgi:hypothetical protein
VLVGPVPDGIDLGLAMMSASGDGMIRDDD